MKIKDNNAKASINFQKANMKVAPFHNAREAFTPQSSHSELASKNECSCSALAAIKKIQKWDSQADVNYAKTHGGRRSPVKETSKVWEAVVNLRENHTMADVKKLVKKLEQKTGYKAAQIAIHRDEGHTNDDGDFIQNIHAHILFYARDPKTGLSLSTKHYGQTEFFEEIQDLTASELGMERGQSAKITGAKHENMHSFKARKQAERAERAQKLAQNNKEWEQKKAEWEQKQAERERKQAEWEKKLPEIMEIRRKNERFLNDKVDWETLKVANRAFTAWHDISTDVLGYPNPNGNLLVEQAKGALASIFRLFGTVSQLAIFLLTRTEARDLKLKNAMDVYKVSENLQRAVNLVANDTTNDHRKIAEKIQSVFTNLPHDKRAELIELAILHAPNDEIREDIKAVVEGRFSHIARTEAAQKRIENRDLRAELKEYAAEAKRIKDELKEMDEENRILNLAERALLREKGAGREQYADQEAENRERLDEIKKLKDEVKRLNNELSEQKKQSELDAETIKKQAEKIEGLNDKIAQITAENVAKQKELEQELKAEKAARERAEIITPKQLDVALEQINELEQKLKQREEQKPEDAFDILAELEAEKIDKPEPIREEPKIEQPEPKIEKPEPEPIKKDDNLSIFGYERYVPEPRRRLDDRPKYEPEPEPEPIFREPEPVKQPEKIEPEKPKDPWKEIEEDLQVWKTKEVAGEKALIAARISRKLDNCEKNGEVNNDEKREYVRRVRYALNMLDPFNIAEQEAEARRNEETIRKVEAMNREREQKRQQTVEIETAIKYDDERGKNVKQEADARQTALRKKKKDELEFGSI